MGVSFSNSRLENRIDKALKQLPYKQSKVDLVETAVKSYIDALVKDKVIKP